MLLGLHLLLNTRKRAAAYDTIPEQIMVIENEMDISISYHLYKGIIFVKNGEECSALKLLIT